MYGSKADEKFAMRVLMKTNPVRVIVLVLLISIFFFGFAVRICETPVYVLSEASHLFPLSSLFNSCWLVIITMTTVGYGDFYPVTLFGRIITTVCCLWGITVISLVVVTIQNVMNLSFFEGAALLIMQRLGLREAIKGHAGFILTLMAKMAKAKRREGKVGADQRDKLLSHASLLKKEQNKYKMLIKNNFVEEMGNFFTSLIDESKKMKEKQEKYAMAMYLTAQENGILPYVKQILLKVLTPEQKKVLEISSKTSKDLEKDLYSNNSGQFPKHFSSHNPKFEEEKNSKESLDTRKHKGLFGSIPGRKRAGLYLNNKTIKKLEKISRNLDLASQHQIPDPRDTKSQKPPELHNNKNDFKEGNEELISFVSVSDFSQTKSNPAKGKVWSRENIQKSSAGAKFLKANSAEGLADPFEFGIMSMHDSVESKSNKIGVYSSSYGKSSGTDDDQGKHGDFERKSEISRKMKPDKRKMEFKEEQVYNIFVNKNTDEGPVNENCQEEKKPIESGESNAIKSILDDFETLERKIGLSPKNKVRSRFQVLKDFKAPKHRDEGLKMLEKVFSKDIKKEQSEDQNQFDSAIKGETEMKNQRKVSTMGNIHVNGQEESEWPNEKEFFGKMKENSHSELDGENSSKQEENSNDCSLSEESRDFINESLKEKPFHEEGQHSSPSEGHLDEILETPRWSPESGKTKNQHHFQKKIETVQELDEEQLALSSSDEIIISPEGKSPVSSKRNMTSGEIFSENFLQKIQKSESAALILDYKNEIHSRSLRMNKTEPPANFKLDIIKECEKLESPKSDCEFVQEEEERLFLEREKMKRTTLDKQLLNEFLEENNSSENPLLGSNVLLRVNAESRKESLSEEDVSTKNPNFSFNGPILGLDSLKRLAIESDQKSNSMHLLLKDMSEDFVNYQEDNEPQGKGKREVKEETDDKKF